MISSQERQKVINSETICNPKEISNSFNTFSATVGHKLASCIPSSSPVHDFSTFLDPLIQSSFYFDPFAPAEVEAEIKVLPNNKAYGLYSCPVSILKLSSHIISQPLAQIFNVSVSSGSFPAKLKTAKVVPVFKSGDESKPGNYRPISLLSIFNRIFEKLVYKRLVKFVNKHNILYSSQYGYGSRHSTQHATQGILNDILSNFNKGHPRRPRGSQSGREKVRAKESLGTDSHRTISKNSSGCQHLIGHKKCFVLLCPIGKQLLLSSFR